MKYKILRLIESKNTMKESTDSDIKRMRQDLYARERQALKDLGDPKWEDLTMLQDRLPKDQFEAFMKEEGKINAIEMIHSILTYTDSDYWTVDYVMSNKYMKKYIEELGEDVVSDIVNQEVEEYKNNAIIDKDTYTDSEGVTYNSVRFKNESAMTKNLKEDNKANHVAEDWERLQKDPMISAREHWSDAYYFEVLEYGESLEKGPYSESAITEAIKRHNFKVTKNNIDEGIYFVKRKEAEEYIKECKARGLTGNYKIVKLNKDLTEDIDTGKDLENDTVNQVVDDMQDETTAEEEEESNSLDNQLADLREVLPDLDLNLYQVIDKEDTNKVFYFIGKVAEDSDDLLMLIDNNPSNDIDEPSNIDNKLPEDEDADEEINDLEDDTEIQNQPLEDESKEERFDFIKVPLKYEDFITLNPRYGNDINPDHEAIMEYLMKCLVEENPERAEELSDDNLVSEEDNTKVPLDDKIQSQIDDKIEFYANN